jgi:hypothetical protein
MQKAFQQLNHVPAARLFRMHGTADQIQLRGMEWIQIRSAYALE